MERRQLGGRAGLTMYWLVQQLLRNRLSQDPEKYKSTFDLACKLIRKEFPKQAPVQASQNHLWSVAELATPHLLSLHSVYTQSPSLAVGVDFVQLLTDESNYLWERSLLQEAYKTSDTAEEICGKMCNEHFGKRANVHAIAGGIRFNHGISQRRACRDRWTKSLGLRQLHLHSLSPDSATEEDILLWGNAWNDLGCFLMDSGSYDDSLIFLKLAWELKISLDDRVSSGILNSELNVSISLAGLGRHEEAVAMATKVAENIDKTLGLDFAVAQTATFTLAYILLSAGRYEDAFPHARRAYERRTKILGQDRRETSDASFILASIEQKRGRLQSAAYVEFLPESQIGQNNV